MKASLNDKEKPNKAIQRNYFLVALLLGIVAIIIPAKAIYISFVEGAAWRKLGRKIVKQVSVQPMRGNIYSCNGELMATSEYEYRIYIDFWADGLKRDTLMKYIDPLSKALAESFPEKTAAAYKAHLLKGWEKRAEAEQLILSGKKGIRKTREYLLMNRKLNYLELQHLKAMPFFAGRSVYKSGLATRKYVKRVKPYGTLASRTIGDIYGSDAMGGKNGLEMQYDSLLKGTPGVGVEKKISGRMITVNEIDPVDGKDIVSTIDVDIQDIAEKALLKKLKAIDAESGTAVVMEVATGEIKAIANMGRVAEGVWMETKNYAVADETEPGSTFKVASMMVALEDGAVRPTDTIHTFDGKFPYADRTMFDHNHQHGGYGLITAAQAIRYSSNIGIARLILKAYADRPEKYVDGLYRLGLTEALELEIPGSGKAKIRRPGDGTAYWSKTTLPWMSIGYETQMPPISILTFFNAIANDGKMIRPYFVKEIREKGEVTERRETAVIRNRICSSKTLKVIREMLIDAVESKDATGRPARSEHVRIAGKTGTAQISEGKQGYRSLYGTTHQVSFCGYFPADRPQYSCIVVFRKPRNGYPSGGSMSGAVFRLIAEEVNARNNHRQPREAPADSVHSPLPLVRAGMYRPLEYLMDKLDIPCRNEGATSLWVSAGVEGERIAVRDRKAPATLVPNVRGMGAKDAVYLLEKQGLRVNLSGRGTVREQSVEAGTAIVRGRTVALVLR
jgi:cell division protein FtsI (penicillin-binding protein 3)